MTGNVKRPPFSQNLLINSRRKGATTQGSPAALLHSVALSPPPHSLASLVPSIGVWAELARTSSVV